MTILNTIHQGGSNTQSRMYKILEISFAAQGKILESRRKEKTAKCVAQSCVPIFLEHLGIVKCKVRLKKKYFCQAEIQIVSSKGEQKSPTHHRYKISIMYICELLKRLSFEKNCFCTLCNKTTVNRLQKL